MFVRMVCSSWQILKHPITMLTKATFTWKRMDIMFAESNILNIEIAYNPISYAHISICLYYWKKKYNNIDRCKHIVVMFLNNKFFAKQYRGICMLRTENDDARMSNVKCAAEVTCANMVVFISPIKRYIYETRSNLYSLFLKKHHSIINTNRYV